MKLQLWFIDNGGWNKNLFRGKVVFVTGGAGTICRGQAEAMIMLGANVAIVGRDPYTTNHAATEMARLRPDVKVIACGDTDVRDVGSVWLAVNRTVAELGKIDFVIAGPAANFLRDFNHLSSDGFLAVVAIDLLGSFNTAKACFDQLRRNRGSILFVAATLHYYGIPFHTRADAATAGVDTLATTLAVEFGAVGIRCNCIAPGLGAAGSRSGAHDVRYHTRAPLERLGRIEDIANVTIDLFADDATGTVQIVDGAIAPAGALPPKLGYPVSIVRPNNDVAFKI